MIVSLGPSADQPVFLPVILFHDVVQVLDLPQLGETPEPLFHVGHGLGIGGVLVDRADNTVPPAELTNDFIALRFVEQGRQLDQVHHGFRSLPQRERPTHQRPDQDQHPEIMPRASGSLPCRGLSITPEPDKSHPGYRNSPHAWAFRSNVLNRMLDLGRSVRAA
jgi:hypothetical protein